MSARETSVGSAESLETDEGETDEDLFDNYYDDTAGDHDDFVFQKPQDPEAFEYSLITQEDAENMLDSIVQETARKIDESISISRILLTTYDWDMHNVVQRYQADAKEMLIEARILPKDPVIFSQSASRECQVCFQLIDKPVGFSLQCHHVFCHGCWDAHIKVQLENGVALGIECMKCDILVGTDHVASLISSCETMGKFKSLRLHELIATHRLLRWCVGANCSAIIKAECCKAKRTICSICKSSYCFQCGEDYHAPTDCAVIKKWLKKCQDDSETAHYIQANTKDCPKCMICIEKNGGCNHMQCYKCKYEFCWVCLKIWQEHNGSYYECSIYKTNPSAINESSIVKAREALKKYLFYYERWQNHGASLKLEDATRKKIDQKIHEKVNNNTGTWIDWQYLLDAAYLLAKCRYTIMYTYPFAYYMGDDRKELFEYQQAQLECEIENLSWRLEREEQYSRGDFENQMDIAEKRRRILLQDFLTR